MNLNRSILYGVVAFVATLSILVISGCSGSEATVASTGGGGGGVVSPCNGVLSGATFTVTYPARSRAVSGGASTTISSALSGKFVGSGASTAGGDAVLTFDRDPAQLGAHSETYAIPDVKTGTYTVSVFLYAGTKQTGALVGTAAVSEDVTCTSLGTNVLNTTAAVASVAVTPATVTALVPTQLVFSAKDATGAMVPVSPGSAIFSIVAIPLLSRSVQHTTLTPDGIINPGAPGTITVAAKVDGVTSPPVDITVVSQT